MHPWACAHMHDHLHTQGRQQLLYHLTLAAAVCIHISGALSLLTVIVSLDSPDLAVSNTPARFMIMPAMDHQPLFFQQIPAAWLCCTSPSPALSSQHVW